MAFVPLVFSVSSFAAIDWNDDDIAWFDYKSGLKTLQANDQLGIVVMYADWCSVCLRYSAVFKDKKVVDALKGVVMIKADAEKDTETQHLKEFDQKYLPKTIIIRPDGQPDMESYGTKRDQMFFFPPDDIALFVKYVNYVKQLNKARGAS